MRHSIIAIAVTIANATYRRAAGFEFLLVVLLVVIPLNIADQLSEQILLPCLEQSVDIFLRIAFGVDPHERFRA